MCWLSAVRNLGALVAGRRAGIIAIPDGFRSAVEQGQGLGIGHRADPP
jgi:hypothetical protein